MTGTGAVALSPAQHGVWFTERVGLAGTAYHLALTVTIRGPVDPDALAAASAAALRAHPQLAGACVEADGVAALVPDVAPIEVHRLQTPGHDRELIADLVRRPFDLVAGPLCRVAVIREAPDRAVLVLVAHHVCFDGRSKEHIVHEVLERYSTHTAGVGEPDGYATTVAEVRARAVADLPAAAERFAGWRPPDRVELPRAAASAGDAVVTVPAGAGIHEDLDRVATELGATRFEVLAAALIALLRRYGNEAPTLGVDVDTRPPGAGSAVGMFVNELPVSVPVDTGTAFHDVVASVRRALRESYAHRYAPIAAAAGGLPPATAIAPVSVSYRRRGPDPAVPGLRVLVDRSVFPGTARGLLHLHVVDGPTGPALHLHHSGRSAVDGEAVSRHLATLLSSALAEPGTPLRSLALLDPAERAALRGAGTDLPPGTVVDLIARQVDRVPDAVALIAGATTVSYAELAARAGCVATRLQAADVRPGAVVAVCASRSAEQVVALLGVLLAGARYLPLDPDHPADRLAYLLADSGAAVVLADEAGAEHLPDRGRTAVTVLPLEAAARPALFAGVARTSDPAYVMYTSGSTGRPKGVAVPHRALVNLLLDMRDRLACGPDTVWLALTSLSFDISLLELLLPLISGARLVIAPTGAGRDGALVRDLIERHAVTHVQATPSGWQVLLAAGLHEPRLTALAGGEALPLPVAAELRRRVGRLWNVYGPTETTIWSTAWPVPPEPGEVRIGAPLANTGVHVVDPDGNAVPDGVPGELYLSGTGLADGYLRRPEVTAERFVVHDGTRCYRTGDRVRRHPDGSLEYLGRFDQQLKLRGHRIEPGEIEAALATHPGVRGVVVTLAGDQLVAYLVPAHGAPTPTTRDLQAHLTPRLPRALHPGRYVLLDALPLTPNGKLDRAALPAANARPASAPPAAAAGEARPGSAPPAAAAADGPVERILCEVLGRDRVAPDDDLMDLGVHSLVITKIAARFRERLGVDVPLIDFFDAVTVADLVEAAGAPR